jgi:aryl-alcohol dehydrogenase
VRIRAAVSRTAGAPLAVEELELEAPRDDEVLVRVAATGVCRTDVNMRDSPERVPRPVVLGHEGAGVVEAVGASVTRLRPGDHVVMTFDACGRCAGCARGEPAYCLENEPINFASRRRDGSVALASAGAAVHSHFFGQSSFATHALCSQRNAVAVRKDVALEILGPLGCGVQTGAGAVMNALRVPAGASIGIFGAGAVGLAAIMAARIVAAAKIVAVDAHASRLELARELGATDAILAGEVSLVAAIKAIAGAGLDYVVDTTGNVGIIRQAVEALAFRGTCGLVSSAKGADMSLNVLHLMIGGRAVRGIVQGDSVPDSFIPLLIELYTQGRLPVDKLVRYYPLAEINAAIADLEAGRTVKPVIRM